jgi:hypothetical protein
MGYFLQKLRAKFPLISATGERPKFQIGPQPPRSALAVSSRAVNSGASTRTPEMPG